jgi:hypothetical protein
MDYAERTNKRLAVAEKEFAESSHAMSKQDPDRWYIPVDWLLHIGCLVMERAS